MDGKQAPMRPTTHHRIHLPTQTHTTQKHTTVDPWWSPAAEMQAIDRTHRIGQYKPIFATRFIIEVCLCCLCLCCAVIVR